MRANGQAVSGDASLAQALAAAPGSGVVEIVVRRGSETLTLNIDWRWTRSVDELELSVRSCNRLKETGIETLGDLVQTTESGLLRTKRFGRQSLNEIKAVLKTMGLSLGMAVAEGGTPS